MWIFDCNDNSFNSDFIKTLTINSANLYQERGYRTDKLYAVVAITDNRFEEEYKEYPICFFDTREEASAYIINLTFKLNGRI